MAYTAPKTWNVGDMLTAPDMNSQVRDNFNYLAYPAAWSVYLNSALTPPATTWTLVPYDTVQYDNKNGYSTSNHGYTIQVAGIYRMNATAQVNSATALHGLFISLSKGSTGTHTFGMQGLGSYNFNSAAEWAVSIVDDVESAAVGDVWSGWVYTYNADALAVGPQEQIFQGIKVSN